MTDDDAGFFRSLSGLATEWVQSKRRALATQPQTQVDSKGASTAYTFSDQDLTFDDLREIKKMREDGGQVAQLMNYKTLLNFGEGAEFHVEDDEATATVVDGEEMTLNEWLEAQFPNLDLLVLDLGSDALWFPYAVGETLETRAGGFKKTLPAEPWTLLPVTDPAGDIQAWQQKVKSQSGYKTQTLSPTDLWHIVLNKSSARDQTGISEVLRSKDEIQAFKQNEQAINQAIELHGFPQRHVKVGKEDGAPIRDNDLRRVRSVFDPRTTDSNTMYLTGRDVEVDTLEAHNFDYTSIHEMDMRNLTTALGLPLEAGNVGADGLGSGKPAELRFALLKLAIKANQRSFATQFVEKVLRPIIDQYSPYDADARVTVDIDDPLEDIGEVADLINSVGDYMTNAEARRKLDLPEPEDDETANAYRSPADIERDEAGVSDGPMGGLFSEAASDAVESALSEKDLAAARTLQEDFDATLFELVATEEQEEFTTGERLGIGVEFPNSGVYVDWNIAAWPEDERLDGPHVSEYATINDAQTVAQGEVRELSGADLQQLADIPEKYTEDTGLSEDDFVPNESILDVIEPTLEFIDEHGLPNPDDQREGAARINQLKDHIDNNDPLAAEFWQEILNFHKRHRAQGNNECDESSLPEKATEIDNSQFDKCHYDNGWFSDRTWGGDPAFEQAKRIVEAIESTEGVELSERQSTWPFNAAKSLSGGSDFRCLAEGITDEQLAAAPEWDQPLLEMHQQVSDPTTPTDKTLVSYAESDTPEFVLERIREAIRDGAMFSQFDEIPSDRLMALRQEFADSLSVDTGFTLDSITENLMDFESSLSRDEAERIARTESSAVLNRAREIGYEEKGDADRTFYWSGASLGDSRQTEACAWLIEQTNPFEGGTPRPMDELREMVDEAPTHDPQMDDNLARPDSWVVHPNERSTFVLAPDVGL